MLAQIGGGAATLLVYTLDNRVTVQSQTLLKKKNFESVHALEQEFGSKPLPKERIRVWDRKGQVEWSGSSSDKIT